MSIIIRSIVAAVIATASLAISACGGAATTDNTSASQSKVPSSSTLDPTREELVAAYKYYVSAQRRQSLQEALDRVSRALLQDLLREGGRHYTFAADGVSPAPLDGYGVIQSQREPARPRSGDSFVQVTVHFTKGQVDLEAGALAFTIYHQGEMVSLNGATTLHGDKKETPVHNAPDAFEWSYRQLVIGIMKEIEINQGLWVTDFGGFSPNSDTPMDPTGDFKVNKKHRSSEPVTVAEVVRQDATFQKFLAGIAHAVGSYS